MYSKSTKKLSLGLYHTQIRQHELDIVAISGLWLDIAGFGTVDMASDWLIKNLGMVM